MKRGFLKKQGKKGIFVGEGREGSRLEDQEILSKDGADPEILFDVKDGHMLIYTKEEVGNLKMESADLVDVTEDVKQGRKFAHPPFPTYEPCENFRPPEEYQREKKRKKSSQKERRDKKKEKERKEEYPMGMTKRAYTELQGLLPHVAFACSFKSSEGFKASYGGS